MSNAELNKLKSGIKNGIEVTLKVSSTAVGDFNDENKLHKRLLTNIQVSKLCKAFANCSSADKKLSKTQLQKIGQWGGFFGRLLKPLLKTGLPLRKNVLKSFAKRILTLLRLTATVSAIAAAIHKKMFGYGTRILIISNKEISWRIWFINKKGLSKIIKSQAKEQKR